MDLFGFEPTIFSSIILDISIFNDNDSNSDLIDLKNDFELIESTKIINDYLNLNKKTMLSSVK